MGMCCLCRCNDLFICGIQTAIADIFHNCSVEQPGILQDHTKQLTQLTSVKVLDVMTIDQDLSGIDIIEPHQQFDHGCLAGTCGTHNSHLLPCFYICGEVMDNDLIGVISK